MSVRVVHGANEGRFDFAGHTVKQISHVLRDFFNIPIDAEALLNVKSVQDDHFVEDGDNLEFVRTFGHKGGLHDFWSEREIAELFGSDAIQSMSELGNAPFSEIVFTGKQVREYIRRH